MATTTPNFGWAVPTSTDLVKDGATAIETLGDSIDASLVDLKGGTTGQVLAKASNTDMDFIWSADASGIPASAFTAKGVVLVGTGTSTYAAQTVGANGTVLTADSTEADGVKWAVPAGAKNYSLLGTGTLTSGSTVTVSGISNMDSIYVVVNRASVTTTSTVIQMRINADTGNNYKQGYASFYNDTTFHPAWLGSYYVSNAYLTLGQVGDNAGQEYSGAIQISGGAAAGSKMYMYHGAVNNNATQARNYGYMGGGWWDNSATITSISLVCSSGTFDAGSFFVYGSA